MHYEDRILKFLEENKNREFSVKELSKETGISYTTTLKWVEVLFAKGLIKMRDYGNIKLVRFGGNND